MLAAPEPAVVVATPTGTPTAVASRRWAVRVSRNGAPNLHKVSENYYRGGQPTPEGFRALRRLGIKTVVNLRSHHSDEELIGNEKLGLEELALEAWKPTTAELRRFLELVTDEKMQPVFVHCRHGSDRTGVFTAVYRQVVLGWSKQEAIREMTQGPYGFHPVWKDLIEYVDSLDVSGLGSAAADE